MYEEPFLYVNMEGKRFCNEDTGFVYMGNITKYVPSSTATTWMQTIRTVLWLVLPVYDNDYMSYANGPIPSQ